MDILHDNSHSILFQIARDNDVPKYVMDSECINKSAADDLSDRLFADPVNREYPIDSKADTWLSAAYLAKTAENRPDIEDAIMRAAETYGNKEDVSAVMDAIRYPKQTKQAEDEDSNYGYPSERKYPMFDETGVKKANAYFAENAYNYPYKMRHEIACNIMRKSAEYGIEPNDIVRMEAHVGIPRRDFMTAQLVDRARRSDNTKMASALMRANEAILTTPAQELGAVFEKIAEMVEEFDSATGINMMYGSTFMPPAQFIFDIPIKQATDMTEDTVVLGDTAFSAMKLAELPVSVFTDALGDAFGKRIEKDGEVDPLLLADELSSLPVPDKNAVLESITTYTE